MNLAGSLPALRDLTFEGLVRGRGGGDRGRAVDRREFK